MRDYIIILLSYLVMIPAALLCYAPMKNQTKLSHARLTANAGILFLIMIPVMSWITYQYGLKPNTLMLPAFAILFFLYHRSLTVHISKSLAVYCYICALMSILSNYANGYDALMNPGSGADTFSMENAVFQLALSTVVTALVFYPARRYGSVLTDKLNLPHVWYTTVIISALFLAINLPIRPLKYQTLYTNKVFLAFWSALSMMLATLLLLTVIFYYIVVGILREADTNEKNRMLEMQKNQYIKLQNYMKATAEVRHNFRQTIRTLESLAAKKDYDAIDEYLKKYVSSIPQNDVMEFTRNNAVNALLNYYVEEAKTDRITLHLTIDIPDTCRIDDIDFCNLLGNLFENAITACLELPVEEREISLLIQNPEGNAYLYIATSNSFNGNVKLSGDRYLSTRHSGNGIGLSTVMSIAQKYGGTARFYHEGKVFNGDIMMRMASFPHKQPWRH